MEQSTRSPMVRFSPSRPMAPRNGITPSKSQNTLQVNSPSAQTAAFYLALNQPGLHSSLFALTPQGTLKWRNESYELLEGPLVASDGTLYICYVRDLFAIS